MTCIASGQSGNTESPPRYTVRHSAEIAPSPEDGWDAAAWAGAEVLTIGHFHAKSSSHQPKVKARALYDSENIYIFYRVEDRYVCARAEAYQDAVYKDSCVEFFVRPKADAGYFNFEMNCGGTLLSNYHEDPTGAFEQINNKTPVSPEWAAKVRIQTSLPKRIDPEIAEPVTWTLSCRIPLALLEAYAGPIGTLRGQTWRANFQKCADESSHPHWATWAPIGEVLNFHQPRYFGEIHFE